MLHNELRVHSKLMHSKLIESAGHIWWPAEFENVANPDFENLKHLQNPGNLTLAAAIMTPLKVGEGWYQADTHL